MKLPNLLTIVNAAIRGAERATRPTPNPPCTVPPRPALTLVPHVPCPDANLGCWRNIQGDVGVTVCDKPAAGPTGLCAEHRDELRSHSRTGA